MRAYNRKCYINNIIKSFEPESEVEDDIVKICITARHTKRFPRIAELYFDIEDIVEVEQCLTDLKDALNNIKANNFEKIDALRYNKSSIYATAKGDKMRIKFRKNYNRMQELLKLYNEAYKQKLVCHLDVCEHMGIDPATFYRWRTNKTTEFENFTVARFKNYLEAIK